MATPLLFWREGGLHWPPRAWFSRGRPFLSLPHVTGISDSSLCSVFLSWRLPAAAWLPARSVLGYDPTPNTLRRCVNQMSSEVMLMMSAPLTW